MTSLSGAPFGIQQTNQNSGFLSRITRDDDTPVDNQVLNYGEKYYEGTIDRVLNNYLL